MRKGDMRRFSDKLVGSPRVDAVVGRLFMVLEAGETLSFLIEGRIERGWGGVWVEQNSEVIDEAR